VLPLFHAYGLTVAMNGSVLMGGTLVLLPRFDLDQVFAAIDEWKPTTFPGVPPIYKALADSPKAKQHDLRSIRLCVSGAMKLPVETQEQFEKVSGGRLVEGYGMTETSPSTHGNPVFGKRKAGTIGMPLPGTECRVVSQDDMSVEVPVGEPGELAIRGPQVFAGYWNRDDETKAAFTPDGFVLTGDIARMDDEGYFEIVDRKKELIIAGGFNIYPSEVEAVLAAHPAVQDVAVIGLPDDRWGERVHAVVVPRGNPPPEAELAAWCKDRIAGFKRPRSYSFLPEAEMPRTATGKILHRVLKARLAGGQGG
jgi:long-chain acyl-CoA synthetase